MNKIKYKLHKSNICCLVNGCKEYVKYTRIKANRKKAK